MDEREDKGLTTRIGPIEIDWPKALGYFGGVWLAVIYEVITPPLGLFIAAIPLLKMLKLPNRPWAVRIASDVLEGAAKPVGGDSETMIRAARRQAARPAPATHGARRTAIVEASRRHRRVGTTV
jgi:hypothetical protein